MWLINWFSLQTVRIGWLKLSFFKLFIAWTSLYYLYKIGIWQTVFIMVLFWIFLMTMTTGLFNNFKFFYIYIYINDRVRSAACDCIVSLVKTLSMDENLQLANAKKESRHFFSHLDISSYSTGFNSIAYKPSELIMLSPAGLDFVLWNLLSGLRYIHKL